MGQRGNFAGPCVNAPAKPLFSDLESCLLWAFYTHVLTCDTIKVSPMTRFQKNDEREQVDEVEPPLLRNPDLDPKPRGLNGSGQAAMIQSIIAKLPEQERTHIYCKYLRGELRREARARMVEYILPVLHTGVHHRHLIRDLVAKAYGKPGIRIADLAERWKAKDISRKKISETFNHVRIIVDAIGSRAETLAYQRLQGIVQ